MPGVDWIPGISQLKTVAQLATLDFEGAKQTTRNFCQECPGVSQITSTVQLATGDVQGALDTQKKCLGTVNNVANGIPVVGHVKGMVHHIAGDHEGGNQAINAATRSTVVVASGAAAAVTTGGIAAIPAGVAAGLAYDASASAVTGEEQGYFAALKHAANNPSAGAIFDAAAIPVADGLAGYSGGQIANKIRVNHWESARAAKMERMDAASTSGEALRLGREANDLTAKINTVKHGTPKYWNDPKTGTVASETCSSNIAAPVSGCTGERENNKYEKVKQHPASASRVVTRQEDALYYDSYVAPIIASAESKQKAQRKLQNSDEQQPKGEVHQNYNNVKFTTPNKLSDLLKGFSDNPRPNGKLPACIKELSKWAWLLFIMPKEFSFTTVAQVNSPYSGLYHSFIRHMREWAEVLPSDFSEVIHRLSPLMAQLNRLVSANNQDDAKEARDEFLASLKNLSHGARDDFQAAMVQMQIAMYHFIQRNLTWENYQGRSLNMNDQMRLYFKVETPSGTKAMVICLSDDVYKPVGGDSRPIRLLITMYFESWEVFTSHGLLETKEEMLKKKKK